MSLTDKVLKSSTLLIGIKTFQRLMGLISILVLARLLIPEDFAIVAIVAITVHFFDILSNAGSEQYIIQKRKVSPVDLNTAWTIDLLMKTFLWACLIASSAQIAIFFEQPNLETALYAASFVLIINALKNPGLLLKKQNLDYKKIFWLSVTQRFITFFIVIIIAYIEQSYWALIIGDIVSSIIFSLGSYKIDLFRPKLTLKLWEKQWGFSSWLLIKGIVGYSRSQIDTLLVSKLYDPAQLGAYYMARDIAMIPSQNIIQPATEPLLAAFKRSRTDLVLLTTQLQFSLFAVSCISIPISLFLWFFPGPVILTLLGNQWIEAIPILSVISLLLFYFSFIIVLEQCLLSLQKVKALFWYDFTSLIFIVIGLLTIHTETLEELALLRGILGIITMVALFLFVKKLTNINLLRIILVISPVLFSSVIAILMSTNIPLSFETPILQLSLLLFTFSITFSLVLFIIIKNTNVYEYQTLLNILQGIIKNFQNKLIFNKNR